MTFGDVENYQKNNPIECLHLSFCKQLLGVRKQTSTDGVLQELGLFPLPLQATKMAIKNWERIHDQKANPIIIASHIDALQCDLPWESRIRDTFTKNGMLDAYLAKRDNPDNNKISIANMLLKRQIDQFNQTSMETIRESNKLRILRLLKQNLGREAYLTEISNSNHRRAMTQFRLSSHALEIERGRYNNTPSEKRFCTYCKDMIGREIVEDEEHFIFHCPISKELREKCTPIVTQKSHLRDEQKLVHILSNKYDIKTTAKYIYLAQEHRKTTLDVLKFIQNLTDEVVSQVRNNKNETYKISDISNVGLKMTLTKT